MEIFYGSAVHDEEDWDSSLFFFLFFFSEHLCGVKHKALAAKEDFCAKPPSMHCLIRVLFRCKAVMGLSEIISGSGIK